MEISLVRFYFSFFLFAYADYPSSSVLDNAVGYGLGRLFPHSLAY